MVKVQLHGDLGKEFESSWELEVSSAGEALRAIESQSPNFKEYIINREVNGDQRYYVAVDDQKLLKDEEFFCKFHKNTKKIDVLPIVGGAAVAGMTFLGKLLIAVAVGAATSMIVSKLFEPPDPQELKDTNSYLFNGAENTESQGIPVPIAYGKLLIGGKVVSAVNQYSDNFSQAGGVRALQPPWIQATMPMSSFGYKLREDHVIEDQAGGNYRLSIGGKTFSELFRKQRSVNTNSPKE